MARATYILILLLFLSGCANYTYTHSNGYKELVFENRNECEKSAHIQAIKSNCGIAVTKLKNGKYIVGRWWVEPDGRRTNRWGIEIIKMGEK